MAARPKVDSETARRVLASFGFPADKIESFFPTCRRDFRKKLTSKILASPFGISFDWRGEFDAEFLKPLRKLAPKLGVKLEYTLTEPPRDLAQLTVVTAGGATTAVIEYDGSFAGALTVGIRNLEAATGQRLVFRVLAEHHPSDTLCVAVLSADVWETVRRNAGDAFHDIFFYRREEYEPTVGVPMEVASAILDSLQAGKKIEAVMHYKTHTGAGALEARAEVERIATLRPVIENLLF